jgi:hypothetical protein
MFSPDVNIRSDWFRLLVQLKDEGYSLYSVAHFTEIPKSTLNGYKQGSQPSYHHGTRLLRFWAQATGQQQEAAPTISLFSFKA